MEEHVISMEQSLSTKFETTNAGETSSDDEENELEIPNERQEKNEQTADWESTAIMFLRSILDDDDQLIINNKFQFPCPKVPPRLRNSKSSKDDFDPKIVSFGPYHQGKAEFSSTQMIKTKVMQTFILEHGKMIEDLYIKVRLLNDHARSCYVDGSTDAYGDEAFALMMLQDSCFILFLIEWGTLTLQKDNINNLVLMNTWDSLFMIANHLGSLEFEYLYRDMLLLENQIPFVVLKVLMSNIYNENEGLRMIKSYLYMTYLGNFQKEDTRDKDEGEPNHLLELLKTLISRDHHEKTKIENKDMDVTFQSLGSFSNLQAKGINLKPSNSISLLSALLKEKPKSVCLRDVDFRSGFFTGELKLPPLFAGNNSQEYYTNLIAFELCTCTDFTVTYYINFMNSFIANPEDVKALRSERIILHTPSSDEEVFKMLKQIAAIKLPQDLFIYQGVRAKIEKHCKNKIKIWIAKYYKNKIKIWIAEAHQKYFSQPWSIIRLLAAVFVIILTSLQTFYTINPRKA